MKTTCLLNFLTLALVIACDFDLADTPYFNGIVQNAYLNSLALLKGYYMIKVSWLKIISFKQVVDTVVRVGPDPIAIGLQFARYQ